MIDVCVFGEILWDLLPSGKKLGGAPANFAYHANLFDCRCKVKTRVGNDDLGREILDSLKTRRIPLDFIEIDSRSPTGTVRVSLNEKGQPTYEIVENVAWDNISIDPNFLTELKTADAFYFGSLAVRSARNFQTLQAFLATLPENAAKVFDLNLRPPYYSRDVVRYLLEQTTVFKLNDDELLILAKMFADEFSTNLASRKSLFFPESSRIFPEVEVWVNDFIRYYRLNHLILTCGSKGSFIFDAKGNDSFASAPPVEVVDTVGAGDSFTAVCVSGLLDGVPLDIINRRANEYAAFVCSREGATPEVPDEYLSFK